MFHCLSVLLFLTLVYDPVHGEMEREMKLAVADRTFDNEPMSRICFMPDQTSAGITLQSKARHMADSKKTIKLDSTQSIARWPTNMTRCSPGNIMRT